MKIELIEGGKMPHRVTSGSIGYDCYARKVELFDVKPTGISEATIHLGFKVDSNHAHSVLNHANKDSAGYFLGVSVWHDVLNFGAFLLPRSGWGRDYGFRLKNTIGLIDPDYRGEVIAEVEFDECPPELLEYANNPYCNGCNQSNCNQCDLYHMGATSKPRVCQMIFMPCYVGELIQVDKLDDTERGTGGFGSTGN